MSSVASSNNPVLAQVWRGDQIESCHRGTAIVIDSQGQTILRAGNTEALVFPRSAIKPIQAIPLLESGAADAYEFEDRHIAFACASHNGEPLHTDLANEILARISLNTNHLVCGAEYPLYQKAAHDLLRQHQEPGREHHNCSGKHSGMLTLCQHMGWPVVNYNDYDHPSQIAWRSVLSDLCQIDADTLPWDFDGCGLPALAMPLKNLALGFSAFANPEQQPKARKKAMQRITAAIQAHPMNIAGSERACTAVIQASGRKVIVKAGAEGVFSGFIPERGLGFVLKMDDGANRAAETALGGLLGALEEPVVKAAGTQPFFQRQLKNSQGKTVGKVTPTWP